MNDSAAPFIRLETAHAPLMARLEKLCFAQPWSEEQCAAALAQPAFAAFGLLAPSESGKSLRKAARQELLAYISLYAAADEMEILNLAAAPEMRRKGLGSRLLRLALQAGRKMGIEKARLEVRESNHAAINLYSRFGFVVAGRRERYYAAGEAALVMTLDLSGGAFSSTHSNAQEPPCRKSSPPTGK